MSAKDFPRRDFLKTTAAIGGAMLLQPAARASAATTEAVPTPAAPAPAIETFEYAGVKLLPSRWQKQYQHCRDFYLNISNDDILCGFRRAANLPAPGKPLGGWAAGNTSVIFGQWLSGMARMIRATGDAQIRDKANLLLTEWGKTIGADGNAHMGHYPFEKLVCGLVDMKFYAGSDLAAELLSKVCDHAAKTFNHENIAAADRRGGYAGSPNEWYTLGENLYRAFVVTGDAKYKTFADMWLYPAYWNKFADIATPPAVNGVHAYSHVNTFSSCAMAYAVTGDAKYLAILKNAYDYFQNFQCFATGGYGPTEFLVTNDGALGRALETRTDSFETVCGSWSIFKMGRYLMTFTGDARYGDWIERILYNGIGAALPIAEGGKNFYYADYRLAGAFKVYNWETWTCCSGTYIQAMADYHNIIYFKDAAGLYVNLFVPSEVTWKKGAAEIKLTQETQYPEAETTTLTLHLPAATAFPLRFRVPGWAKEVSVKINGTAATIACKPGTWAVIDRTWNAGDKVELHIPLPVRMVAIDKEHPHIVALVRGPVALVQEGSRHDPLFRLPPTDEELNKWLTPSPGPGSAGDHGVLGAAGNDGAFSMRVPEGALRSLFRPFYTIEESFPYRMYYDTKTLPLKYW